MDYIKLGKTTCEESLLPEKMSEIFVALKKNKNFEFIGFELLANNHPAIITDLVCTSVPSRNKVGIKNRERFAIIHIENKEGMIPYFVFPLRSDFPDTLHLNNYYDGFPRSLCLYLESWREVEREFTVQKFLKRIEEWILLTSKNELHSDNQPLEQLYFNSKDEILIPADYQRKMKDEKYVLYRKDVIKNPDTGRLLLVTEFEERLLPNSRNPENFIHVKVPPVEHLGVCSVPETLGKLEVQFNIRKSEIIRLVKEEFERITPSEGIVDDPFYDFTILLVSIPRLDNQGKLSEKLDIWAFIISCKLGEFGEKLGVLLPKEKGKYYRDYKFSKDNGSPKEDWREILIHPVYVVESLTKNLAQTLSGVNKDTANFQGSLIGAGALGSSLADNWSKSGWGSWLVIDGDQIKIHNLVRHIASFNVVGRSKSTVVAGIMNSNYEEAYANNRALYHELSLENLEDWYKEVRGTDLIVDATATKYLLKELSNIADLPRSTSMFLSPSGNSAILLLEDKERNFRLEYLEMLYYRSIINEKWGKDILKVEEGRLRVGAGCSDLSNTISYEAIKLYSALLSKQLRIKRDEVYPVVKVWKINESSAGVECYNVAISEPLHFNSGEWTIVTDKYTIDKLRLIRQEKLPNETGGILVGYIDQKLKKVYIVDGLPAPIDSKASENGFIRGANGALDSLTEIQTITNEIVNYIGEWHSHPKNVGAKPSSTDLRLVMEFSQIMSEDGLPHLMIIIGENEVSYSFALAG